MSQAAQNDRSIVTAVETGRQQNTRRNNLDSDCKGVHKSICSYNGVHPLQSQFVGT